MSFNLHYAICGLQSANVIHRAVDAYLLATKSTPVYNSSPKKLDFVTLDFTIIWTKSEYIYDMK